MDSETAFRVVNKKYNAIGTACPICSQVIGRDSFWCYRIEPGFENGAYDDLLNQNSNILITDTQKCCDKASAKWLTVDRTAKMKLIEILRKEKYEEA